MTDPTYRVVWPRSAKTLEIQPLAARPESLEGKTVAQLWDTSAVPAFCAPEASRMR